MKKKMLINVMHPEEARVAIVEDGLLVDLDIEIAGSEQTRGNVYKGMVVRVEPGLQAAFVDIGLKKLGFLQMGELHPEWWQWREDVPEEQRKRRPRIQEVLRRGQELIVQVEKGERDNKGAALTTYLSLPGRYIVIMPGSDSAGISRKVESESERKKLKAMAQEMEIPEDIGYIFRTEALGHKKNELVKDFEYLVNLYQTIREKAEQVKAPALIYRESDLVIRMIRDYFTADFDEVLVDSKEVYKQARAFFKATMPKYEKLVKVHQEKRPIFSKFQLEEQIDLIYEKKVPLRSGGSIFIEPTEALVSIDVNSGKSTGEKGVEDTAFKTNLEAAEEVARQLRLRDLGGLIVIDFIDMRERKHNTEVEKTLKSALKADKARVTVGKISQFGMLEMSRQRIKPTIEQAIYLECPHCSGRGKVKSAESMALSFLRKVHSSAAKGTVAEVRGALPLEVAYYLLNRKKRNLAQIEDEYDIEVTVKGKPSFLMNQLELELVKRDKPLQLEAVPEPLLEPVENVLAAVEAVEQTQEEVTAVEELMVTEVVTGEENLQKKKKRRRGKKKGKVESESLETVMEETGAVGYSAEGVPEEDTAGTAVEPEEVAGVHHEEGKKKRRRRRKRGGKAAEAPAGDMVAAEAPVVSPSEEAVNAEAAAGTPGPDMPGEEGRKKRRRKRRRSQRRHGEEAALTELPVAAAPEAADAFLPQVAVPSTMEHPAPAPLPFESAISAPKPRKPRGKKVPPSLPEAPMVTEQSIPQAEPLPKPKRQGRPKKVSGIAETSEEQLTVEEKEPKPMKKRAPRKKKVVLQDKGAAQTQEASEESFPTPAGEK